MKTELESERFIELWNIFLKLIEEVAFKELLFKKIYTYSCKDLRPKLYSALLQSEYELEAELRDHVKINSRFFNVLIHSKFSNHIYFEKASEKHVKITYDWHRHKIIEKIFF